MCGRYIENSEDEVMEIREILKQISMRLLNVEYNAETVLSDIFPSEKVIIINKAVEMTYAKWGVKKWDNKGIIINAKSETYEQSKFFKPFANNRCIVPAHGYYEWQTLPDKKKIKYVFTSKNKHGIFMAGICKTEQEHDEFAIITKPAEDEIKFIHDRMPLIIRAEQAGDWLKGTLEIEKFQQEKSYIIWKKSG
jgi:putative SOS response-associated peptidase YedK